MTCRELKAAYRQLNKRFFNGRLPADTTVEFARIGDDGACWVLARRILIHTDYQRHRIMARLILLHEMNHLDLGEEYIGVPPTRDHGIRFGAGIVRLFNAGAYDDIL